MYDFDLLKQLYELHSPSGKEKKMARLLTRLCQERGATVTTDKKGNLFVTKGRAKTYPCICAHMDQVQRTHAKDFTVYRQGDIIFAFSAKAKGQQGLGADDKNGLWIALELLSRLSVLKCAFFVGEEIGCVGSNACDLTFFKDVRFCIQPDRRNGHDLITSISGKLCSEEFIKDIGYGKFHYVPTSGLSTDVGTLVSRGIGVSCINISCGYYDPHTDHEVTSWSELCNALAFAKRICSLRKTYPHKYTADTFFGGDYGWRRFDFWDDYDDYYYPRQTYDWHRRQQSSAPVKLDPKPQQIVPVTQQKPFEPKASLNVDTKPLAVLMDRDDDDHLAMRAILNFDPSTTFEEICKYYMGNFQQKDFDLLRDIYKDEHVEAMKQFNY